MTTLNFPKERGKAQRIYSFIKHYFPELNFSRQTILNNVNNNKEFCSQVDLAIDEYNKKIEEHNHRLSSEFKRSLLQANKYNKLNSGRRSQNKT